MLSEVKRQKENEMDIMYTLADDKTSADKIPLTDFNFYIFINQL